MIEIILFFNLTKGIITFNNPYLVLSSPIISTIKVFKDSNPVPYKLKGDTVYPLIPLKNGDTIEVIYESFFYKKDTTLFKPKPFIPEEKKEKKETFKIESESQNINFSGEKTLSAGISDQGFKIEQSMHFEISGEISEGYRVSGVISDESYPDEEGFTRNLSELEEASIRFEGKDFFARLGEFKIKSNSFRNFSKEMLGIEVKYRNNREEYSFSLGYPRGRFKTVYIELINKDINTFTLIDPLKEKIVPGSEKVYLDGKPLKPGREGDYIIDYSRGTITLTPNLFYTSNSNLRVDLEVTENAYSNWTFLSGFKKNFKFFNLNLMFFNESDIPSMPKILLTDEDKEFLKNVNDTSWVMLNGIVTVDSGEGDYVLKNDTLIYVGKNKGDIKPQFIFVGPGKGDYDYVEEKGYFVYVGENMGSYKIGKWGLTPKSLKDFIIGLNANKKNLNFNCETGFSFFNQNLFNKYLKKGYFNNIKFKINLPFKISPGFEFYFLNKKDFKSPFRVTSENYFYYWAKKFKGNFYDLRLNPFIDFYKLLKIKFGYSYLGSENLKMVKKEIGFEERIILNADFNFEEVSFKNYKFKRYKFYIQKQGTIIPFYGYNYEIDTLNNKKIEEKTGFKINFKKLKFGYELLSFRYLDKRELKNGFKITLNHEKGNLRLTLNDIRKIKAFQKNKDFLYYAEANLYPNEKFNFHLVSNLRKEQGEKRIFEYVYVGKGRGSFEYDSLKKIFYPDPEGSYIKRVREIPLGEGIYKMENEGSLNFNLNKFYLGSGITCRNEKGGEKKDYLSFYSFLNFNFPLNPSFSFIFNKDENYLLNEIFKNKDINMNLTVKKTFLNNFTFETGFDFKSNSFESYGNKYVKRTYGVVFSGNYFLKEKEIRLKLLPGYIIYNYFLPEEEKFTGYTVETKTHFLFLFLFKTKFKSDIGVIFKKPFIKSYVSNFDKDRWRINIESSMERNLTNNILLILKARYRRGSVSKPFYNFYLESKLLF